MGPADEARGVASSATDDASSNDATAELPTTPSPLHPDRDWFGPERDPEGWDGRAPEPAGRPVGAAIDTVPPATASACPVDWWWEADGGAADGGGGRVEPPPAGPPIGAPDWVEVPPPSGGTDAVPADDPAARRVDAWAAVLVEGLDLPSQRARAAALRWLRRFGRAHPSSAARATIAGLVHEEGCSFDELKAAAAIRAHWRETSELWLVRRFNRLESAWTTRIDHRLERDGMSWRLALRLARIFECDEVVDLTLASWREVWLDLDEEDEGYHSLVRFIKTQATYLGEAGPAGNLVAARPR